MPKIKINAKNTVFVRVKNLEEEKKMELAEVARMLGANVEEETFISGGPPVMDALRESLSVRLISKGGRPGLLGATRRQKIPLVENDWVQLYELSRMLSSEHTHPSPAQIASVIIHEGLERLQSPEARKTLKEKVQLSTEMKNTKEVKSSTGHPS